MGPGAAPGPMMNKGMYMRRSAPYHNPQMMKGRQVPGGQQYPNGTQVTGSHLYNHLCVLFICVLSFKHLCGRNIISKKYLLQYGPQYMSQQQYPNKPQYPPAQQPLPSPTYGPQQPGMRPSAPPHYPNGQNPYMTGQFPSQGRQLPPQGPGYVPSPQYSNGQQNMQVQIACQCNNNSDKSFYPICTFTFYYMVLQTIAPLVLKFQCLKYFAINVTLSKKASAPPCFKR